MGKGKTEEEGKETGQINEGKEEEERLQKRIKETKEGVSEGQSEAR